MTLGTPARLDASALIDLAERATQLSPGQWSLALMLRAYPQVDTATVMQMPVGARDRLILAIRARLRAGPLRSEPVCEACGATYELSLEPEDIGLAGTAPWPSPEAREIRVAGKDVTLRPVVLGDLLAAESEADPEVGAELLAQRALNGAASDVPQEQLAEALEALDPGADIWLDTACPECDARQSVAFDPVYFVAGELQQLSRQVLQDVVDIARVFHWSEADILALPEHRRAFYVAEALS